MSEECNNDETMEAARCPNPVPATPIGVNPPGTEGTQPITRVYAGDQVMLHTQATLPDGTVARPDNSIVRFVLTDQKFSECIIWEGRWNDGVTQGDNDLLTVTIPCCVSEKLRRGSYTYAMTVTNTLGECRRTVMHGSLLVEYSPASPHKDIPYKDSCPNPCEGIGPALSDRERSCPDDSCCD